MPEAVNPAGPGYGYDPRFGPAAAATPPSSASALTFGILALVFGPTVLIADIVEIFSQGMAAAMSGVLGAALAAVQAEQRAMAPFVIGRAIVMALMSIALIVIGIGLVSRRQWGRVGAVVWSCVAFGVLIGRVLLWELAIQPHMDRMMAALLGSLSSAGLPSLTGLTGGIAGSGRMGEYLSLLVLATFPIVMIALMTRPGVKARMLPPA